MNKKISTTFAIAIIVIIAGFFSFMFLKSDDNFNSGSSLTSEIGRKKAKKISCSKHAYDGEAKIRVWSSESQKDEIVVAISEEDTGKLPENYQVQKAKLVDAPKSVFSKIETASSEKPAEIIIKGFYDYCGEYPSISLESGEKIFKKFLKEA